MKPDKDFVAQQAKRMQEIIQQRQSLNRDDLEYVVEKIATLRDKRLQECVAELIGWGDDERAELETFVAIAIEVMKRTNVSKLRECAQIVEFRYFVKDVK
jgi:hypothetical protein